EIASYPDHVSASSNQPVAIKSAWNSSKFAPHSTSTKVRSCSRFAAIVAGGTVGAVLAGELGFGAACDWAEGLTDGGRPGLRFSSGGNDAGTGAGAGITSVSTNFARGGGALKKSSRVDIPSRIEVKILRSLANCDSAMASSLCPRNPSIISWVTPCSPKASTILRVRSARGSVELPAIVVSHVCSAASTTSPGSTDNMHARIRLADCFAQTS